MYIEIIKVIKSAFVNKLKNDKIKLVNKRILMIPIQYILGVSKVF